MKLSSYLISHTSYLQSCRRGFTIVETLIAIAILMIAIAGPLVVASKGLNSALYAKDQMIASFLAQETMEAIKNKRDNNIANNNGWLEGFDFSLGCNSNTEVCTIDTDGLVYQFDISMAPEDARVYHGDTIGYYHDTTPSGSASIFKRYFYFDQDPLVPGQVRVNVIVDWYEHSIPFQVMLQSQMTDVVR